MDKKVLILGASGFIGQNLIGKLTEKGYQITALVRSRKSAQKLRYFPGNTVISDQGDEVKFRECFRGEISPKNIP